MTLHRDFKLQNKGNLLVTTQLDNSVAQGKDDRLSQTMTALSDPCHLCPTGTPMNMPVSFRHQHDCGYGQAMTTRADGGQDRVMLEVGREHDDRPARGGRFLRRTRPYHVTRKCLMAAVGGSVLGLFTLILVLNFSLLSLRSDLERLEQHLRVKEENDRERPRQPFPILHNLQPLSQVFLGHDAHDVALQRHRRAVSEATATPPKQKRRSRKKGKKKGGKGRKGGRGKDLPTLLFIGSWADKYNPLKGYCIKTWHLKHKPKSCLDKTLLYSQAGSVLSFYKAAEAFKASKKRKIPLMNQNADGQFVVRTAGVYALSFNITFADTSHTHSVGIFLNDAIFFACAPGGVRCSRTNEIDSSEFRLCTASGVTELHVGDVLDIRTLNASMTIKLKRNSHFWAAQLSRKTVVNNASH